jgi:hypothetical protein
MMTNFLMPNRNTNKVAVATGIAALAGVAIICAIPKTRKACGEWISNTFDNLKNMTAKKNGGSWQEDLEKSEKLKGPVGRRKNTAKIQVPSAGTNAWKDEWSSE